MEAYPPDERVVLEHLQPIAAALVILYVLFTIFNALDPWMGFSRSTRSVLVGHDILVVLVCFGIYTILRNGLVPLRFANQLTALLDALILSNVILALIFSQNLFYSYYVAVTMIGVGTITLSLWWLMGILLGSYGAWFWSAWKFAAVSEIIHFSFLLFASAGLSIAVHRGRVAGRRRLFQEISLRVEIEEKLVEANASLREQSRRDSLTGLLNRRGIFERFDLELSRRNRGHSIAVLLLDIDGFKTVNDIHGHVQGDNLLQAIATVLHRNTRASDAVGRYGGDEFLVLLSDAQPAEAKATADRLIAQIRCTGQTLFPGTRATASCGLAMVRQEEDSMAAIERADAATYEVKIKGGDSVAVAS